MNKVSGNFLSCDWGTSFFRLRLVAIDTGATVAEVSSSEGIAAVFKQWQQKTEERRLLFYLAVIQRHITLLEQKVNISLQHLPLIVSGMASSTIGMIEVGYKELPFSVDGSDLAVHTIVASEDFPHDVYVLSGAKTGDDVMRGEETQVIGCMPADGSGPEEQIVILPGTHSKHIMLKEEKAVAFQTYMTGEFFEILSQKSILSVSVEGGGGLLDEKNRQGFERGVLDSQQFNLLHACFRVRTNQLFQKMDRQQNYYYLSGLLIGAEVQELIKKAAIPITLVCNEQLKSFYAEAFQLTLGDKKIKTVNADEAIVRGQMRIYAHFKEKERIHS
jgi:2-dehydro-3-deoxygalactonokinase